MKLWFFPTLLIFCFVISCKNHKQVIKQIKINQISLKRTFVLEWYRESYLTRTNVFIALSNDHVTNKILMIDDGKVTDIRMNDDSVLVKLYNAKLNDGHPAKTKIEGFKIVFQQATYKEWFMHYHVGEKFYPINGL